MVATIDFKSANSGLKILGISVGIPFFVLSCTSSLLQAWFSGIWIGRSPYRLYALSNIGSLLGLLSYPFLIEPVMGLGKQAMLWATGFMLFCLLCSSSALLFLKRGQVTEPEEETKPANGKPTLMRRMLWVLLSATGCVLLLATTNKITQEIAVIPMLWVLPLTIYLLSYIFAFSGKCYRHDHGLSTPLALVVLIGIVVFTWLASVAGGSTGVQIFIYLFAMFIACMYCHGELYLLKPAPSYLTGYYLALSVGGAMGGLFVAVAAPVIFTTIKEFLFGYAACVAFVILAMLADKCSPLHGPRRILWRAVATVIVMGVIAGLGLTDQLNKTDVLHRSRNFYGTLRVEKSEIQYFGGKTSFQAPCHSLKHGRTLHGVQVKLPELDALPTSYYGRHGGAGLALTGHPNQQTGEPLRVGLVGLGVGTLAVYGRTNDVYRVYEIDADVYELADGKDAYFTFLADSDARIEKITGDARLKLEQELLAGEPQGFDVLVLDAFSGDAVPVHLLTHEAFHIYRKHLAKDGMIAIHISSRFFDLSPLIERQAIDADFIPLKYETKAGRDGLTSKSVWMLLLPNQQLAEHYAGVQPPTPKTGLSNRVPSWSDDYSNPLQLIVVDDALPFFRLYEMRGE